MKKGWTEARRAATTVGLLFTVAACGGNAQESTGGMVVSGDPELRAMAEELLPELARRSGLPLREPVRIEKRSRGELVRYLEGKLDEELPPDRAARITEVYTLLGLVPQGVDLRRILLDLYTEQVAGFYDPDSTALFVLDDQPASTLQGLLVHELVHAVQDQSADLDALTDPEVGNDRSTAAQAAIEGHATLVMLEYLTEQMQGQPVDLSAIPDFASTLRPALEGMRGQFPALSAAPEVIQESLLFPYIEGAGYVQALWAGVTGREEGDAAGRRAPFGALLPESTEQILERDADEEPVALTLDVRGGTVVHEDNLGSLELSVFLGPSLGAEGREAAKAWEGDRYALIESGGARGLVWFLLLEDEEARDRLLSALGATPDGLGGPARLESWNTAGRPGLKLIVGDLSAVSVDAKVVGDGGG